MRLSLVLLLSVLLGACASTGQPRTSRAKSASRAAGLGPAGVFVK